MGITIRNPEARISNGQLDFIRDLIDSKQLTASPKIFDAVNAMDAEEFEAFKQRLKAQAAELNMGQASEWIERLKALPYEGQVERQANYDNRQKSSSVTVEPEAGMYRATDGAIIRVYLGQQSGKMLVKRLVDTGRPHPEDPSITLHEYEYVGAAKDGRGSSLVAGATPLPLDEAKEFGRMSGSCCVCARRLDVPESVEAGIGPVCAGRLEIG